MALRLRGQMAVVQGMFGGVFEERRGARESRAEPVTTLRSCATAEA